MSKIVEREANELQDANVSHVSLVKRGAIRTPFRIIKADVADQKEKKDMIDLGISRLFAKADAAPAVAAIIVNKTADVEKIQTQLKEHGFVANTPEEKDGALVFAQGPAIEDHVVVKMNDDVAVAVSNVKKMFEGFGASESFMENLKSTGFYPSMHVAMETLRDTMFQVMNKADSNDTARKGLEKAFKEFSGYMLTLADSIPVNAFKLDKVTTTSPVAPTVDTASTSKTDGSKAAPTGGEAGTQKSEESASAGAGGSTEATKKTETKPEGDASKVTKTETETAATGAETFDPSKIAAILDEKLKPIQDALGDMQKSQKDVSLEVTGLKDRIGKAEDAVKKTEDSVRGVVGGTPPADRADTKKSDVIGPGLLDTAFSRPN